LTLTPVGRRVLAFERGAERNELEALVTRGRDAHRLRIDADEAPGLKFDLFA
jgi:hypothetical protein